MLSFYLASCLTWHWNTCTTTYNTWVYHFKYQICLRLILKNSPNMFQQILLCDGTRLTYLQMNLKLSKGSRFKVKNIFQTSLTSPRIRSKTYGFGISTLFFLQVCQWLKIWLCKLYYLYPLSSSNIPIYLPSYSHPSSYL